MKIQQIIRFSSVRVEQIIEKKMKKEDINPKKAEYSTSGVVVYLNLKPELNSKETIKIEQIIELSPMEVKMIIQKYFEKYELMVRRIKFTTIGLTIYLPDAPTAKKDLKSTVSRKMIYKDEKFSSLSVPTGLINLLEAQGIERLSQLEDLLLKKIASHTLLTPEAVILSLHLLGINYYNNLIDALRQKNIQISSTGAFELISQKPTKERKKNES